MTPEVQETIVKIIIAVDIVFMLYFVTRKIRKDLNG